MTSHTVTRNTNTAGIQLWKHSEDSFRQLFSYIAVHIVATIIRSLSGIHVEASAGSEVPRIVLSLDFRSTYDSMNDD